MLQNSRLLIIQDIENFYINITNLIYGKMFKEWRLVPENDLDNAIDWIINQHLQIKFSMKVIGHYRHDVYRCIYDEYKGQIDNYFNASCNKNDLNLLKNCEVKTLVNGSDLFIARRITFKHFL